DTCNQGVCCSQVNGTCKNLPKNPCAAKPDTPDLCGANSCTDLLTDANNCGECGRVCPSGICTVGSCCDPKSGTPDSCPGASGELCTNVDTDANNCGACGNQCATGQPCDTTKSPP